MRKKVVGCLLVASCIGFQGFAQAPQPTLRTDLIQPAPNAAAFEKYISVPVNLARGTVSTTIPLYQVTEGTLSMPITLSYNYNGCKPSEHASWVGLGWTLAGEGVITRMIRGKLDNTSSAGENYEDFSIWDSIQAVDNRKFFKAVVNLDAYDLQPDIYTYNFSGHSGRFIWYKGKAYLTSYENIRIIHEDESSFTVITPDGAQYIFANTETTTTKTQPSGYTPAPYISSWHLTEVFSANGKDHITFSYTSPFTYRADTGPLSEVLSISTSLNGNCPSGSNNYTETFSPAPHIGAISLLSIDTRSFHIEFDTLARFGGSVHEYPSLGTMKIFNKDEDTNQLIQQWRFTYSTSSGKLLLTELERLPIDDLSADEEYRFDYEVTTNIFPDSRTTAIDYWGYYNGQSNFYLFPEGSIPTPQMPYPAADRAPHFDYAKIGVLKSIRYPTGGGSTFEYELNTYPEDSTNVNGPGVRVKKIISNDSLTSTKVIKYFRYNETGSVSSGRIPPHSAYSYKTTEELRTGPDGIGTCNSQSETYQADYGNGGDKLYYARVSEIDTSNSGEAHKTQYDYNANPDEWDLGVDLLEKRVYAMRSGSETLIEKETNTYGRAVDSLFIGVSSVWATYLTDYGADLYNTYSYLDGTDYCSWKYLVSTVKTIVDDNGNSLVTSTINKYDHTRNLTLVKAVRSGGDTSVTKFKYTGDYTVNIYGPLVKKNILDLPVETQLWVKKNATDSLLQGGEITKYDTTFFKPIEKYYLESQPLASLDNESTSSGLYSTLLSDSHYKKRLAFGYEYYGNVDHQQMSDNVLMSYLWDYNAALPIAQVVNAASTDVGYAGFESFTGGGWTGMIADSVHFDSLNSAMGQRYYHLVSSLSRSGLDTAKSYTVSYWSRNGSLSVNSTSGTSIYTANGWTLYTHTVSHPSGGTITASGTAFIDELRVLPVNAQMTTYAYKPGIGMIGQGDLNNFPTHYHYDGLNRLQTVQDKDRNIIKTIDYHYKGQ